MAFAAGLRAQSPAIGALAAIAADDFVAGNELHSHSAFGVMKTPPSGFGSARQITSLAVCVRMRSPI
jgi:hypothetical protein